ncbi:MAG: hypothetical protein IKB78_03770 [Clostridia bacterium]|nr:hypothetical protein [Clostridia bacterium]
MKKEWNVPRIETLDVRLTFSGNHYFPLEGDVIFKPEDASDASYGPVKPEPS